MIPALVLTSSWDAIDSKLSEFVLVRAHDVAACLVLVLLLKICVGLAAPLPVSLDQIVSQSTDRHSGGRPIFNSIGLPLHDASILKTDVIIPVVHQKRQH